MPDADDAAEPEVLPAGRRDRAGCRTASSSCRTCKSPTRTTSCRATSAWCAPRLADAKFFYDQDRRRTLASRVARLWRTVVYHNKLGTQLERVERIERLAGAIARKLGADETLARRAARLAKADLLTGMVGEFPELQGMMGRTTRGTTARPDAVARAIEAHYRPRFAGDALPDGRDRRLRRARRQARHAGRDLVDRRRADRRQGPVRPAPRRARGRAHPGRAPSPARRGGAAPGCRGRSVRGQRPRVPRRGCTRSCSTACARTCANRASRPTRSSRCSRSRRAASTWCCRALEAVRAFRALPEAESLAAANKRIRNILRKAEFEPGEPDPARLHEAAEKAPRRPRSRR